MTPFGNRLRDLRRQRGMTLQQMAQSLNISAAYLSALEHGKRGVPTPGLVMEICGLFGLIWDEAEALKRLADISRPKVLLDTSGLSPLATAFANRLAQSIRLLDDDAIATLDDLLVRVMPPQRPRRRRGEPKKTPPHQK